MLSASFSLKGVQGFEVLRVFGGPSRHTPRLQQGSNKKGSEGIQFRAVLGRCSEFQEWGMVVI